MERWRSVQPARGRERGCQGEKSVLLDLFFNTCAHICIDIQSAAERALGHDGYPLLGETACRPADNPLDVLFEAQSPSSKAACMYSY